MGPLTAPGTETRSPVALTFNLLMTLMDLAGLGVMYVRRSIRWSLAVGACEAVAAAACAILTRQGHSGIVQLAAWALFLHGSILLAGTAVLFRRSRRRWAIAAAAGVAVMAMTAIDGFLIEPYWLEVSHLELASPKIGHPVRIAVIADFQTDHIGPYERQVVRRVIAEKPDLVLYAGDYLQVPYVDRAELAVDFRGLVEQIGRETSSSAFAVGGNVDGWLWTTLFDGVDVTVAARTETFQSNALDITCLSLRDSADPQLRVSRPSADRFHVVLGHVPNFALGQVDADLLLAGHTHGGQCRLPLIGPLVTHSLIPHAWAAGVTRLPGGGRLVVSRGIGMEREYAPRCRFCCRPEVVIIDLVPGR